MTERELPTQIGPYSILRRIGRGGMAEVFLATYFGASGFEKKVAVKTLLPELQGEPSFEKMLIEEAKLGARFRHKNVLQVHDLGLDESIYYVRLEYIEGASLASLCARSRPPESLALWIASEIALGLDYLHKLCDDAGRPLGIVHRDVSPGNVLLSVDGEVKLSDFGTLKATLLSDVTWGKLLKGKYAYMSPEQVRGEKLTPASDLFSLGVLLVELLTGERPFDGETPLETMERIKDSAAPKLSSVPEGLRPLLLLCLAPTPKERFESAAALYRALGTYTASLAAPSLELSSWVRTTHKAQG